MGRRPFPAALVALVAGLVAVTGACGGGGGVSLRHEQTGAVAWSPCDKVECGTISVPLDYAHPAGGHITLALARLPASGKRLGVLFTNPGGPGGSGVDFVRQATGVFPEEIRAAFDIVSWDPRGLGPDSPVHCLDDLDPFYAIDHDPTTPAGVTQNVAASRTFVDACRKNSAALLAHMTTAATVRDMDAIRAAMGDAQISYVGFSYGTLIGSEYADEFPHHVRAMVLDGVVDPARSYADSSVDQATSFDADLSAFFAHCRSDSKCAFAHGGDPAAAYDDLQKQIAQETEPATVDGEPRTLGPGEFDIGVALALYSGADGYDTLASALTQAAGGDGTQMVQLSDQYTGRQTGGRYSSETAAFYATSCVDAPSPSSVAAVQQLADQAARVAPHFGASTIWLGLPCTLWPVRAVGKVAPIRAPDAPPIVVLGTTHDPATPYAWAQSVATELKTGHLLTADGTSHTSYGGRNQCVDTNVDRYLLTLAVPAAGTTC